MNLNWLTRRRQTTRRPNRDRRLRLECLEDRSVPAVFTVNSTLDEVIAGDGKRSLREAISAANAAPGADTIVLPAGVFKCTTPGANEDQNAIGDFDIMGDVTIQGAGAGLTIVDGQQLDRVFDTNGNGNQLNVTLQALTIRGGNVVGSTGGGVRFFDTDLVVRDCVVAGNRTNQNGGGIGSADVGGGRATLIRTTLVRNSAIQTGGGVSVSASTEGLTVKNCTLRQNVALGAGGAIHTNALTMNSSSVKGNWSLTVGGGISADDATLTNCIISGNTASAAGGGIRTQFPVTLTNCVVSGNFSGDDGGGIKSEAGVTLTSCTVSGNSANDLGGGVDTLTVDATGSTISGNHSRQGGGISGATVTLIGTSVSGNGASDTGGGVHASSVDATGSTINGNSSGGFGGGGIRASTATLTGTTLSGNRASNEGGGLHAITANLTRCTVNGNSAGGAGGGVFATTAFLTNTTVSGNAASGSGGGLIANSGELLNCTVVENTANVGGGVVHQAGGVLAVRNTIIALNLTPGAIAPDISGAFTSSGHNLIGNGSDGTGFTHGVNGDLEGDSVTPIDPKLGPLANNGGKTKTHALKAGSLAVDAGDNTNVPAVDQRGLPRVKDGNGDGVASVDIGALER